MENFIFVQCTYNKRIMVASKILAWNVTAFMTSLIFQVLNEKPLGCWNLDKCNHETRIVPAMV